MSDATPNATLQAALEAARRGWFVLPAYSTTLDKCHCNRPNCKAQGKHPLTELVPHGLSEATTDEAVIRSWWARFPDANLGVVMGPSGLVAFDVDLYKNDGEKLQALFPELGILPETLEQNSGSGEGVHLFYRDPGVPIRGAINNVTLRSKAYCIIAPSLHKSGKRYMWDSDPQDTPIAHLPEKWVKAVCKEYEVDNTGVPDEEDDPGFVRNVSEDRRISLAWDYIANEPGEEMGVSPQGLMFTVARRIVRGFAIRDTSAAYKILAKWNERCSPPYEEERLKRNLGNAYSQATNPPWGENLLKVAYLALVLARPPTEDAYRAHWRAFINGNSRSSDAEKVHKADTIKKLLNFDSLKSEPVTDPEEMLFIADLLVQKEAPGSTTEQHVSFVGLAITATVEQVTELIEGARKKYAEEGSEEDNRLAGALIRSDKGPRACGSNIAMILRDATDLKGHVRFNELFKTIEITGGIFLGVAPNDLVVMICNWLETKWGLFTSSAMVAEQILTMARRYASFDPIAYYLNGLVWDKKERIDTWLVDYAGAKLTDIEGTDVSSFVKKAGARWLISAVARALDPGCKVDTVLVLEGAQGAKKSTAFDILGGKWFTDSPLVMGQKDSMMLATARWVCELAELASVIKSDVETQKAFLSARKDDFRPPYGKVIEPFDRRCVFAGTVNPTKDGEVEYLVDETGDRRWWPIRITTVDADRLREDRDQLWAEAAWRYLNSDIRPEFSRGPGLGERWWFEGDEQKESDDVAKTRHENSAWAPILVRWAENQARATTSVLGLPAPSMTKAWPLEVLAHGALEIKHADLDRHKKHLGKALREAGFVKIRVKGKKLWGLGNEP